MFRALVSPLSGVYQAVFYIKPFGSCGVAHLLVPVDCFVVVVSLYWQIDRCLLLTVQLSCYLLYHQSIALNVTKSKHCTRSLYVHCMHWLTQYGRRDFLRYTVGFVESDKVLIIRFDLFICKFSIIFCTCPVINYQFFDILLSLQLKSRIPQTKSHFTPHLSNLRPRWPHCKQPRSHMSLTWLPGSNLRGHYTNFFY